ncbi:unnamed protein product [Discosporangium mesarthrocarpum]
MLLLNHPNPKPKPKPKPNPNPDRVPNPTSQSKEGGACGCRDSIWVERSKRRQPWQGHALFFIIKRTGVTHHTALPLACGG